MIRQWEEFPVGPNDEAGNLHVTLSRKGEILLGAAAFERLGKPEAAVLLFDKINSVIGLLPSPSRNQNAYPLKAKSKARHRIVRANKFCRHYGIRVDRTVAFNMPEIDEEGILVLNLRTTTAIGSRQKQDAKRPPVRHVVHPLQRAQNFVPDKTPNCLIESPPKPDNDQN